MAGPRAILLPLCLLVLSSCGADEEPQPGYTDSEYEGLSLEEMQRQAESMTPEQAESLGIVDTTIRIEVPIGADSVLPEPIDTTARSQP